MSRNNDVFNVLFLPNSVAQTSGRVGDLTAGQWGVFNYDTGAAVTATSAANIPAKFIIAYNGDGTLGTTGRI